MLLWVVFPLDLDQLRLLFISTPLIPGQQLQPQDAFAFYEEEETTTFRTSRSEVSLYRTHDQRRHNITCAQRQIILSTAHRNSCFSYAPTIITSQLSYQCSHRPYYIKYGTGVQLAEAAALRLVAEKTSIPVPKVHCAFKKGNVTYIVMDKIEGKEIGKNWAKRPAKERESLLQELRGYFEQLCNIPHPRLGTITAADGQSLYDHGIWKGLLGFGLFLTENDFNLFLRNGVTSNSLYLDEAKSVLESKERIALKELVDMHGAKSHSICFTHGDASGSNVPVKNGIVAPKFYSVIEAIF